MNKLHTHSLSAVAAHHFTRDAFHADVIAGLSNMPKRLACKYFYDEQGSRLFEQICQTPEYYPTRTEIAILRQYAPEIAQFMGPNAHLVELGSGPSTKVRILLDAAAALATYVPVDISGPYLLQTAHAVARDYPSTHVVPVCADFTTAFKLPRLSGGGRSIGFFPGSTIGNFSRDDARTLLRCFGSTLGSGSGLLVGVDLKKDSSILHAAYNDASGITAAFNLNILKRINRELGGDFDLAAFSHRAIYNPIAGRIEMYLDSSARQVVNIGRYTFRLGNGEAISTEHSYKYDAQEFTEMAASAGYACRAIWKDERQFFAVFYLTLDN